MDFQHTLRSGLHPPLPDLAAGGALLALLALGAGIVLEISVLFYCLIFILYGLTACLVLSHWPASRSFGAANRITLLRGVLVILLVGLAPFADQLEAWIWPYSLLCLLALLLDGVDGAVARRTGNITAFGARFDMELDALFILGLCVALLALDKAGVWVLALGLMRYGFVLAGYFWPFLNQPLPESFRRKTVCVWQLVTLMVAVLPLTPDALAGWSLITALALLVYSFVTDIRYLFQSRRTS